MSEDGAASSDSRKRSRESSAEPRRTHRKTETRVFYSEVMAQEREMERINFEKSRHQQSSPTQLRKGETVESPAKRSKQKRAEERRTKRQKLRCNMSPRSPDGGPQLPLRSGVSLVNLEGDAAQLQRKRRFARDEDAIHDATLHSTAWRNLKFAEAPGNLLPDRDGVSEPFALVFDAPLEEFGDELKEKCAVSTEFLKSKPLTMMSGTRGEAKEELQVEERVKQLIEEATPLVKKCHAARANAIIAKTRQQIAAYLEQRPVMREKACTLTGLPLQISRLEKVAARRLLRDDEFATEGVIRPHYSIGRTEADHSGHVYPEVVTFLSKIAPIPRSTTCMLSCGTHRVEDDPIIRFVPYFSANNAKNKAPQFSSMESCKDTLVGMDNEVNEYVLRYVVSACGGDQAVFEALQRCGAFTQPFANYSDILERVTRERLYKKHLHELEAQQNSVGVSGRTVVTLLEECFAARTGAHLRGRLQPFPAHVLLNHLQEGGDTGVRNAPSKEFKELAIKYQDFFCRRCCTYSCRNHGREQPVPVVRVDPSYPLVKASVKLWRRVEEEQLAEVLAEEEEQDDADDEMDGEQTPESDEPMSELTPAVESTDNEDKTQKPAPDSAAVGAASTRRSSRAQTAASTKASSKKLNAIRLRKLVRSKTSDVSEYLGFDGIYQSLTQDRKSELLSADMRCGPHCCKPVSDTTQDGDIDGFSALQDKRWDDSEVALLDKLERCIGPNPCALAALIATRSCTDVAEFLRERESRLHDDLHELGLFRSGPYGRNRDRSNGVLGNSFEHLRRTRSQRMKDRGANHEYVPCNHDGGSCDSAQCSCMRRDHYCEKSCGCSPDCSNRFPGCHCEVGQCRTSECPCYFAARECDPDVCTSCGASELPVIIADEESKGKTAAQLKTCGNVNIMRGQMRKIGVSASETHGWGAYAMESVKKGEFLYEYTGSLLSQDEAERRGNVYDKTTISFLFDLNEDSVVDATRKGNKSKFANHDSGDPKCFARIMLVNGDHRIGIYAKQGITAGDELFFDYGYSGVIPDWSQSRIGSSKDTASVEEDDDNKASSVDVKEEREQNARPNFQAEANYLCLEERLGGLCMRDGIHIGGASGNLSLSVRRHMEYNWGDPKKNSLLSSRMMAKAEVTRKKRLTSVRSTLSNQLHPAIENKLRKKKKAPDSARRHLDGDDNNSRSSCNNNDTYDGDKTEPQLASDDESSTLDTIRHDVFPVPARASYTNNVSMFDEFDQNAAADGLFHPASAIEAFAEHDAKYHQEIKSASGKSRSGPRRARSGSEYPPSRENHRLPALHRGKIKRVSTRPEEKMQRAINNGSAPASMTTASSLSKLVDADNKKRGLSATQSDSKLYAPRGQDTVPSTADRNALDFLEREFECESDNNPHNSPVAKSSRAVSELDNNEAPDDSSSVVPQLDISLARKFEQLKHIMKSNREKHNSARGNSEHPSNEAPGASSSSTGHPKASSRSNQVSAKSTIRASSSGSSATKNGGEARTKGVLMKRSTPAARASENMNNGPPGSKHTSGAASRKTSSSVAVAKAPLIRSRKEMKVRSGVSLSALKAEHQEALQMLKELGGPMDLDYLHVQIDVDSNTSKARVGRNITRTTGINRSSGSTMALAGSKSTNQLHAGDSALTPPTSSVSMVTKLRESISSGRSRESSPRPSSSSGREVKKDDASSLVPESTESNQTRVQESAADITAALDKAALVDPEIALHSSSPPSLSPNKSSSDPWKQYEDDIIGDEDEDNNELEHDGCSQVKAKPGGRYSDEDFESDR
ncbi:hypothetical protein PC110_g77 [Phytophthora cactorum]|nr:hypothetical protein PC110_g77 [Phytophthora cactorum]